MKSSDIGSSVFLMALGGFMAWQAEKLNVGSPRVPGPGFFPFCLALLLIAIALMIFLQALKQKPAERKTGTRCLRAITALAAVFAYAFLLDPLGYLLSTFFLMVLLIRMMVKKTWWFAPAVAFVIALGSYLVFKIGMQLMLPRGILGL